MVEKIKKLVTNCDSIQFLPLSNDMYTEIRELYGVTREITDKVYTKLISFIWDVGEILMYQQKLNKSRD